MERADVCDWLIHVKGGEKQDLTVDEVWETVSGSVKQSNPDRESEEKKANGSSQLLIEN